MAEVKTRRNDASVAGFVARIGDPRQREDARAVLEMMKSVTRMQPKMWGTILVGFGKYHYKYASGWEGECFLTGFSPRKGALLALAKKRAFLTGEGLELGGEVFEVSGVRRLLEDFLDCGKEVVEGAGWRQGRT